MTELSKNNQDINKNDVSSINVKRENVYTNKKIRECWLDKTEEDRRVIVRNYFFNKNSENINTLYGIMPEELEEIYLKNTIMQYVITYHDSKNKLQKYTQKSYDSQEIAKKEIDYYIENKYENARFLNIMEANQYYKIIDKRYKTK